PRRHLDERAHHPRRRRGPWSGNVTRGHGRADPLARSRTLAAHHFVSARLPWPRSGVIRRTSGHAPDRHAAAEGHAAGLNGPPSLTPSFPSGACLMTKPIHTIAILGGSGHEGSGLALRWARAGHRVIIGSRNAEKARAAAAEMNHKLGQETIS